MRAQRMAGPLRESAPAAAQVRDTGSHAPAAEAGPTINQPALPPA